MHDACDTPEYEHATIFFVAPDVIGGEAEIKNAPWMMMKKSKIDGPRVMNRA